MIEFRGMPRIYDVCISENEIVYEYELYIHTIRVLNEPTSGAPGGFHYDYTD